MKSRRWLWGGIGVAGAAGAIGGAWILSLPPAHDFSPPPLGPSETQALVEGLRPPKRQRPLVAAVGINDADLDLAEGLVRIRGKGRRERLAPIGTFAAKAIARWLKVRTTRPPGWPCCSTMARIT